MNKSLQTRLNFALDAAVQSSKITLGYFGSDQLNQDTKGDGTPVTIADRACETDLRQRIEAKYPDDSILGEEFGHKIGSSGYEWVIDPIDGTISFIHGVPLFGTMLACLHDGKPVVGVIVMPALDEVVYAADGCGCWHQQSNQSPKKASVSTTSTLSDSMLNTTSMSYFTTPALRKLYEQLDSQAKHTRGWSDCYGWVLLATGRVDAVIEPVLSLWDFAAAIPIVKEAGGMCSDLSGTESITSGELIASNGLIHEQLVDLISGSKREVAASRQTDPI